MSVDLGAGSFAAVLTHKTKDFGGINMLVEAWIREAKVDQYSM